MPSRASCPIFAGVLPLNVLESCDSWRVFDGRVAGLAQKEKGDAFELLVKLTLQLHPLYATKLEKVWLHSDVPSDVREQLRLPPKDKGVDLVDEIEEAAPRQVAWLDDTDCPHVRAVADPERGS